MKITPVKMFVKLSTLKISKNRDVLTNLISHAW